MVSDGLRIADGVTIEELGNELIVMVPGRAEMYRLTGDAREVVLRVQELSSPSAVDPVVAEELIRIGVLSSTLPNRRRVLRGIGIGAGAGILALSVPSVAAASSSSGDGGSATVSSGAFWGPISATTIRFIAPANIGSGTPSNLTIANPPTNVNSTISLTNATGIFWEQAYGGQALSPVSITGSYTRSGVQYQATFLWNP